MRPRRSGCGPADVPGDGRPGPAVLPANMRRQRGPGPHRDELAARLAATAAWKSGPTVGLLGRRPRPGGSGRARDPLGDIAVLLYGRGVDAAADRPGRRTRCRARCSATCSAGGDRARLAARLGSRTPTPSGPPARVARDVVRPPPPPPDRAKCSRVPGPRRGRPDSRPGPGAPAAVGRRPAADAGPDRESSWSGPRAYAPDPRVERAGPGADAPGLARLAGRSRRGPAGSRFGRSQFVAWVVRGSRHRRTSWTRLPQRRCRGPVAAPGDHRRGRRDPCTPTGWLGCRTTPSARAGPPRSPPDRDPGLPAADRTVRLPSPVVFPYGVDPAAGPCVPAVPDPSPVGCRPPARPRPAAGDLHSMVAQRPRRRACPGPSCSNRCHCSAAFFVGPALTPGLARAGWTRGRARPGPPPGEPRRRHDPPARSGVCVEPELMTRDREAAEGDEDGIGPPVSRRTTGRADPAGGEEPQRQRGYRAQCTGAEDRELTAATRVRPRRPRSSSDRVGQRLVQQGGSKERASTSTPPPPPPAPK